MEMQQKPEMQIASTLQQTQWRGLEILGNLSEEYRVFHSALLSDISNYGVHNYLIEVYVAGPTMSGKSFVCGEQIFRLRQSEEVIQVNKELRKKHRGSGAEVGFYYFSFGQVRRLAEKTGRLRNLNGNFTVGEYLEMGSISEGIQEAARQLIIGPAVVFNDLVLVTQAPLNADRSEYIGIPRGNVAPVRRSILNSQGYAVVLSASEQLRNEAMKAKSEAKQAGAKSILDTLDRLNIKSDLKDLAFLESFYQRTGNAIIKANTYLHMSEIIYQLGLRGLIEIPDCSPLPSLGDFQSHYSRFPEAWQNLLEESYYPYWIKEVCGSTERGYLVRNPKLPDGIRHTLYVSNLSHLDLVTALESRIAEIAEKGELSVTQRNIYQEIGLDVPPLPRRSFFYHVTKAPDRMKELFGKVRINLFP